MLKTTCRNAFLRARINSVFFSVPSPRSNRCCVQNSEQKCHLWVCCATWTLRPLLLQTWPCALALQLTRVKIIGENVGNDPKSGNWAVWVWSAVLLWWLNRWGSSFVLYGCFLLKVKISRFVFFSALPSRNGIMGIYCNFLLSVQRAISSCKPEMSSSGGENIKQSLCF